MRRTASDPDPETSEPDAGPAGADAPDLGPYGLLPAPLRWLGWAPPPSYRLTRALLVRALGALYLVAFVVAWRQLVPLVGEHGLLPASLYLEAVRATLPPAAHPFWHEPTLFWWGTSDALLEGVALAGALLSLLVVLGLTHAAAMGVLWALYLSICHVGQLFWGYGWEILLLEAGFLGIFLCPVRTVGPLPRGEPPVVVLWLYRWLTFRLMLGAGLIKIRGDACWRELTCLQFHYETQPLPNPLSWLLHQAPPWFHTAGVLFNHLVELVVPFLLFGPRRLRYAAGALTILFQGLLILSGNLSFLNWLSIVVALACFDDQLLCRLVPARLLRGLSRDDAAGALEGDPPRVAAAASSRGPAVTRGHTPLPAWIAAGALTLVVGFLSCDPVLNLVSPRQAMNRSFDRLHLVNTYGAFGSVGRTRDEVVISGTLDANPGDAARWREYELPCKPGAPLRPPCVVAPYQPRLDWQLWFAAFSDVEHEPWLVNLVDHLLRGEPTVKRLLAHDPFPRRPPRWVKLDLYRYRFTRLGDGRPGWWVRELEGPYLRPVSRGDPEVRRYLELTGLRRPARTGSAGGTER